MTQSLSIGTSVIHQHDGLYSLNDLHRASGGEARHQPALFIRLDQTQALIAEVHSTDSQSALKTINGGRNRGTYACRELVIAYAAWISAAFHLKVIRVFLESQTAPQKPAPVGNGLKAAIADVVRESMVPNIKPPEWPRPMPSCCRYPGEDMRGEPRTINSAKKLVRILQIWAREQLPHRPGEEVYQLLEDLRSLLITGWTEVDEALSSMSNAMRYLNRWQGRNGRIGNIG